MIFCISNCSNKLSYCLLFFEGGSIDQIQSIRAACEVNCVRYLHYEIWILPINSTISAMSTKSYGERIPPKSRNVFSFNKFIYFSFMFPSTVADYLLTQMIKPIFCIDLFHFR